jgi:HK97 gp10 family phage protein
MDSIDAFFARIEEAGIAAAMAGMNRWGEAATTRAKHHAPVRMVFRGQEESVQTRLKSISEVERDRHVRASLGLGTETAGAPHFPRIVTKAAPQMLGWKGGSRPRAVVRTPAGNRMKSDFSQSDLSARGAYELRSGRAIHNEELGGTLRDEIYFAPAVVDGRRIIVRIVSPTAYAKFQEFGTRHNPAHPYLRPGAYETVETARTNIARSIPTAVRKATAEGLRIKVTARLKVA